MPHVIRVNNRFFELLVIMLFIHFSLLSQNRLWFTVGISDKWTTNGDAFDEVGQADILANGSKGYFGSVALCYNPKIKEVDQTFGWARLPLKSISVKFKIGKERLLVIWKPA